MGRRFSESEQFRFGVAFQIALAMGTALRFVVIDRADVLDKEKRKFLTSLLVNSELHQAIVLAPSEEAPPSAKPQPTPQAPANAWDAGSVGLCGCRLHKALQPQAPTEWPGRGDLSIRTSAHEDSLSRHLSGRADFTANQGSDFDGGYFGNTLSIFLMSRSAH